MRLNGHKMFRSLAHRPHSLHPTDTLTSSPTSDFTNSSSNASPVNDHIPSSPTTGPTKRPSIISIPIEPIRLVDPIDDPVSPHKKSSSPPSGISEPISVDDKPEVTTPSPRKEVSFLVCKLIVVGSRRLSTNRKMVIEFSSHHALILDKQKSTMLNIKFADVHKLTCTEHKAEVPLRMIFQLEAPFHGMLRGASVDCKLVLVELSPCRRGKYDLVLQVLKRRIKNVKLDKMPSSILTKTISPKNFYGKSTGSSHKKLDLDRDFHMTLKDSHSPTPARSHRSHVNYHMTHSLEIDGDDDIESHINDVALESVANEANTEVETLSENVPLGEQIVFLPDLNYKMNSKRSMVITNNDFKCLYNGNWINDSIVDFFLSYDFKKASAAGHLNNYKVEIFNSFFFTQLTKDAVAPEDCYKNVKSWFKTKNSLFDNDFVVIPVMADLHWFAIILSNLRNLKAMHLKDSNTLSNEHDSKGIPDISEIPKENGLIPSKAPDRPKSYASIFILDSLRKIHSSVGPYLKNFLIGYAKDKYGFVIPSKDFKQRKAAVPRQKNFNDCGLHVIYNLNLFFQDPERFKEKVLYRIKRPFMEMFDADQRKNIRRTLREVLINLLKEQVIASGEDASKIGKITNDEYEREKKNTPPSEAAKSGKESDEEDDDLMIIETRSNVPPKAEGESSVEPASFTVSFKYSTGKAISKSDKNDNKKDLKSDVNMKSLAIPKFRLKSKPDSNVELVKLVDKPEETKIHEKKIISLTDNQSSDTPESAKRIITEPDATSPEHKNQKVISIPDFKSSTEVISLEQIINEEDDKKVVLLDQKKRNQIKDDEKQDPIKVTKEVTLLDREHKDHFKRRKLKFKKSKRNNSSQQIGKGISNVIDGLGTVEGDTDIIVLKEDRRKTSGKKRDIQPADGEISHDVTPSSKKVEEEKSITLKEEDTKTHVAKKRTGLPKDMVKIPSEIMIINDSESDSQTSERPKLEEPKNEGVKVENNQAVKTVIVQQKVNQQKAEIPKVTNSKIGQSNNSQIGVDSSKLKLSIQASHLKGFLLPAPQREKNLQQSSSLAEKQMVHSQMLQQISQSVFHSLLHNQNGEKVTINQMMMHNMAGQVSLQSQTMLSVPSKIPNARIDPIHNSQKKVNPLSIQRPLIKFKPSKQNKADDSSEKPGDRLISNGNLKEPETSTGEEENVEKGKLTVESNGKIAVDDVKEVHPVVTRIQDAKIDPVKTEDVPKESTSSEESEDKVVGIFDTPEKPRSPEQIVLTVPDSNSSEAKEMAPTQSEGISKDRSTSLKDSSTTVSKEESPAKLSTDPPADMEEQLLYESVGARLHRLREAKLKAHNENESVTSEPIELIDSSTLAEDDTVDYKPDDDDNDDDDEKTVTKQRTKRTSPTKNKGRRNKAAKKTQIHRKESKTEKSKSSESVKDEKSRPAGNEKRSKKKSSDKEKSGWSESSSTESAWMPISRRLRRTPRSKYNSDSQGSYVVRQENEDSLVMSGDDDDELEEETVQHKRGPLIASASVEITPIKLRGNSRKKREVSPSPSKRPRGRKRKVTVAETHKPRKKLFQVEDQDISFLGAAKRAKKQRTLRRSKKRKRR